MSPTSYQAAPPRVSEAKCRPGHRQVKPCSSSLACRVWRLACRVWSRKAVEQFLVASHHPEFLARDALLHHGIGENRRLHPRERIHVALERVDLRAQPRRPRALRHEIGGAPLTALYREDERRDHDGPEQNAAKHRSRGSEPVDRATRELGGVTQFFLDAEQLVVLRDAIRS